jgi:hypothetical protein
MGNTLHRETRIWHGIAVGRNGRPHLLCLGDAEAAGAALSEARAIADRLHCQPLLDRAADLAPAEPRI